MPFGKLVNLVHLSQLHSWPESGHAVERQLRASEQATLRSTRHYPFHKTLEVLTMPENLPRGEDHGEVPAKPTELSRLEPLEGDTNAQTHDVAAERSLRVLVVDPQQDMADATVRQVRDWGHDGRAAYDAAAGLELAARHVPEVVFLDLAMPGINGSELAKELRLDARLKRCFLIAITGHAKVWRQGHHSQTDIDLFLPKPIDALLMKTLLLVEGKRLGPARNGHRSLQPRRNLAAALCQERSSAGKDDTPSSNGREMQ